MIPPEVRAAIAKVGFVACPDRCGPVEVIPDEIHERPRICHAFGDCRLYLHPDSDEAATYAESVDAAIGRHVVLGTYDDSDLPVHAWGGAALWLARRAFRSLNTEVPPADRARTLAHLTSTVLAALGRIDRHAVGRAGCPATATAWSSTSGTCCATSRRPWSTSARPSRCSGAYFPAVRDELGSLTEITDPASTAPVDTDRSAAPSAVGFRCGACGGPRTPGGPCDDPECRESGDPGQRARDRAYKETTARYVASSVNGALDD